MTATALPVAWDGPAAILRGVEAADVDGLHAMLQEPSVREWWGDYDRDRVVAEMLDDDEVVAWVIEMDGRIAGFVQATEELEPQYRHASIDILLSQRAQGRSLGTAAVRTVARWLIEERGHHRVIIDPAASNARAIAAYAKVGFRPVGLMRQYEQGLDGRWHDGLLMDLLAGELT